MSSNKTTNYQLHLWEPEDDFIRSEFNENNEAVDTALAAHDTALTTRLRAISGSYTGTGETTNTIFVGAPVKLLLINCASYVTCSFMVAGSVGGRAYPNGDSGYNYTTTWSDDAVTLTGTRAYGVFNDEGITYYWMALC